METWKYYLTALLAACGLGLLTSCEHDVFNGEKADEKDTPNLFDYLTKKDVTIILDYATNYAVPFEIYYSNPYSLDEHKNYVKGADMKPFISGKTNANGKFSFTFSDMPAAATEIFVYSPDLTVPQLLHGSVNGQTVNLTAEASKVTDISKISTRSTRALDTYYEKWKTYTCTYNYPLGNWDEQGTPSYLNQGDNINQFKVQLTDKFHRTIEGTLRSEDINYSEYLTHEYITISEAANVYINFVSHNGSERNNALAYYTLAPGEKEPDFLTPPTNFAIAFPNLRSTGLKSGDVIQLKYYDKEKDEWSTTFPVNSRIGLVLLVDAFENGQLKENTNLMYSDKKYNSYNILNWNNMDGSLLADRPQMLAFTADGNVVLSFEDMPWHGNRKPGQPAYADFSDDIFTITSNPISALPDDVKPGVDPEEPQPEEKPFTVSTTGILAFEDKWPEQGDYDINDVVFAYQRTFNMKSFEDLRILSIDETYIFKNDGASYTNGFGYVIGGGVKRDDVEVTVTSDIQCSGQGIDADLEDATVMIVDNAKNIPVGTTFHVKTTFKTKTYEYYTFAFSPYNPFIVVTQYSNGDYLANNRVEVHLPRNYRPTQKADPTKFGTGSDLSTDKYYYVASNEYPFALEIVGGYGEPDIPNFMIPAESKRIEETYPKFIDWVSNPKENADWWKK